MDQKFQIVFENDDFCVVNKEKGLITHGTLDKTRTNLFDLLKLHYQKFNKEVFLLHRLDKDTSGLMLFSLNIDKNKELQQMIQDKKMQKTYLAKTHGTPPWNEETILKDYLKKTKVKGIEKMVVVEKGGDVALARAKTLAPQIVQITLMTGRMHQIRIQLSSRGFPILGDEFYGGPKGEICLHSSYLKFSFQNQEFEFTSEPSFFTDYKFTP